MHTTDDTRWQPTQTTATATVKPLRQLTRKQQAFVKHLIDNPKDSAAQAARAAYNLKTTDKGNSTARAVASENLAKPNIMLELSKHSETAELVLLDVMKYSNEYGRQGGHAGAAYASTARQTANDILDRLHGKATTKVEQTTTAVTLNIDLTGVTQPEADQSPTTEEK